MPGFVIPNAFRREESALSASFDSEFLLRSP